MALYDGVMDKDHNAFLARMSHELRTPLNAIIGYSEMINDDLEFGEPIDPAELKSSMDKILGASQRLLGQVQSILDLTQLEADKYEVIIQPIDIETLVARVRQLAAPIAAENRDQLLIRIDAKLPTISADSRMVEAILTNLVQNACKFTKDGNVTLDIVPNGFFVLFKITDDGIGMTPRQIENAFAPFAQADSSTVRQYDGSGVGLAVCKGFAELMGGGIVVESTPGHGASVFVRIPRDVQVVNQDWDMDDEPTVYGR